MKAVILSGTPSTRAGITEHLSVVEDVEKPAIKSDQVLMLVKATLTIYRYKLVFEACQVESLVT